jgi:hypothetical protein
VGYLLDANDALLQLMKGLSINHYCSWPAALCQATSGSACHVQCSSAHGLLWHHAPAWLLRLKTSFFSSNKRGMHPGCNKRYNLEEFADHDDLALGDAKCAYPKFVQSHGLHIEQQSS